MQALVYAPQHQFSFASPDKSWSRRPADGGNPTILSDADVDAWLMKNQPEVGKELRREARACEEAQSVEMTLGRVAGNHHLSFAKNVGNGNEGVFHLGYAIPELQDPPKHWAFALYPGCGSVEICALVAPLLTERENAVLRMQFAEGKSGKEMGEALGIAPSRVFFFIKQARVKLYKAAKLNQLPPHPDPQHFTNTVRSLDELRELIEGKPQSYHTFTRTLRPKRQAYVCDCGHHLTLTNADLDHRKVVPGLPPATDGGATRSKFIPERQFRCRFCGRTYPESQWHKILC